MKKILLSLIVLCCAFVAKAQNDQLTAILQPMLEKYENVSKA